MSASGSTDKPAYQLLRGSTTGTARVATAAGGGVGNGVAGTGSGAAQTYPVHVRVPDTNHKPARYSDTVIVTLNF